MKLILPVSAGRKKLSAIFSDIFSANNHAGILNEEWIQYKDVISGTPDVCSNNITTPTPNNNISDDAKQCDASFLFTPVTAISDHLPYPKESTIRSFLHSSKTNVCNIFSFQNFLSAATRNNNSVCEVNTTLNSFFNVKKIVSRMMGLFFVVALLLVSRTVIGQTTVSYSYTGANQTFTVPAGVTSLSVKIWGAGGAGSLYTGSGGAGSGGSGALVKGTMTVTSGQSLVIVVGGGGIFSGTAASAGGFGGGGASGGPLGGSGGGYSGIFNTSISQANAFAISGSGAGGGYYLNTTYGGAGGATTGSAGGTANTGYTGGGGGTVSTGGTGGLYSGSTRGSAGSALTGGAGFVTGSYGGGGGGGGYYGGGGGYGSTSTTNYSSGGGGGSSYLGSMTSITNTAGTTSNSGAATQSPGSAESGYIAGIGNGGSGIVSAASSVGGNGLVVITYTCPTYALTSAASAPSICGSGTSTVTLNSTTLPNGTYNVTYSTTNPTTSGNTSTMPFSGGAGTFTTISLSATSILTVNILSNGTSPTICSSTINSNNTASVTVSNPVPSVTGQTNPLCFGGSNGAITISGSGGTSPYSYSVNNGSNWTPALPVLPNPYTYPGLVASQAYKIRIKDNNGCTSKSVQ